MSAAALRLATRASPLALAQTALAAAALRATSPRLAIDVVVVSTAGDRDRETPLQAMGGQGVFVAAIEQALIEGRADVAVHSLKDVPARPTRGLMLGAFMERGDPRDVFVGSGGRRLADLPLGARIGTSSSRRAEIVRGLRPDVTLAPIRGNVDTRLRKVAEGEYDGIVLAAAGLQRLGRFDAATECFDVHSFVPSPGQAVVALECRADDARARALLAAVDHAATRHAVTAERAFLARLGAGCDLPVGAFARVMADMLTLRGLLGGTGRAPVLGNVDGAVDSAETLGADLAEVLLAAHPSPPAETVVRSAS